MTDSLPNRQKIEKKLNSTSWFKATDPAIQEKILNLSEDYDGYLEDLATRPDEIGELDVLKMTKVSYGQYLVLSVFEVRSNLTNQVFTYEYVSWKTGNTPGARGIIFLESEGKISHFVVSLSHKFSTGKESYEAIGGLYLRFFGNKAQNLPKKVEEEICFHLGIDHLEFTKVISLGQANPDLGMTNNVSDLFVAIVDISHKSKLITKPDFRSTHKPVGFEIKVIPISEFTDYLGKIDDNYFLSAAARALSNKEIDLNL